jgi:hypothetical protein
LHNLLISGTLHQGATVNRLIVLASTTLLAGAICFAGQANSVPVPAKKKPAKSAQSSQKLKPAATAPTPGTGGAVVFVDPVTHQIREATPEEIGAMNSSIGGQAAARAVREPGAAPASIQGPGGAVGIPLGPEFDTYVVVTKTPDGKLKSEEVTGDKAARQRVVPAPAPKATNAK